MTKGVNKGLEDVAELGRELEKAAIKAGYGSTIKPESIEKLVRAISDYQVESLTMIADLRERERAIAPARSAGSSRRASRSTTRPVAKFAIEHAPQEGVVSFGAPIGAVYRRAVAVIDSIPPRTSPIEPRDRAWPSPPMDLRAHDAPARMGRVNHASRSGIHSFTNKRFIGQLPGPDLRSNSGGSCPAAIELDGDRRPQAGEARGMSQHGDACLFLAVRLGSAGCRSPRSGTMTCSSGVERRRFTGKAGEDFRAYYTLLLGFDRRTLPRACFGKRFSHFRQAGYRRLDRAGRTTCSTGPTTWRMKAADPLCRGEVRRPSWRRITKESAEGYDRVRRRGRRQGVRHRRPRRTSCAVQLREIALVASSIDYPALGYVLLPTEYAYDSTP